MVVVFLCMYFPTFALMLLKYLFSVLFMVVVIFTSTTLCRAIFVHKYYLNLALFWNILIFPSRVFKVFLGIIVSGCASVIP